MNEIYLRGKLVSVYEPIAPASQPKHIQSDLFVVIDYITTFPTNLQ